jgi:hypothetical protein
MLPLDEQARSARMSVGVPFMGHGPCTFKEVDLVRALKAAKRAGVEVARAEIAKDGKIVLVLNRDRKVPTISEPNEWDEEYGADQTEVR